MNYIGSKKSLLSFLYKGISEISGLSSGIFIDGFAGTGAVGKFFQEKGFSIIANDIQYYSFIVNNGRLCIPKNTDKIKKIINELNNLKGVEGFIYNNYCAGGTQHLEWERLYFSDENGKKCDAMRMYIEKLRNSKKITQTEYYYCIYCLLEAIDKVANTASVYGAFLKQLKKSALKPIEIQAVSIDEYSEHIAKVLNDKIENIIETQSADILYLDPPYNQRQYAPNYHVLETIAKHDNPILRGKTGLRDYDDQKSDFCSKVKVDAAFESIIKNAQSKYIFLSYNNEGLMTPEKIQEILSKYGKSGFFTQEYGRFKADKTENRNHTASSVVEYLHWIVKKDI